MSASADDAGPRLERALAVYLAHCRHGGADGAALLRQHEDLREFLEPMLAPREAPVAVSPEQLGDFRIVRELGRGGMGVVYEAWQRSLDRRVALKVLVPALVASPAAVARFRREASLVARLEHPGIVAVYGFGGDGAQHWFAMELVDGQPLQACRAQYAAPVAAVELIAQVVDALQHAHATGLVHRDVKPANILVRDDGRAVLTDFGLASDTSQATMTVEGSFLGTLDYASPEQVQGERVDARTDVWSIGVVLYELLAGQRPFARATATATMHAILTSEPPDVRRARPEVSADLAAVVAMALAKAPAQRYASAAALLADLRAVQVGGQVQARPARAFERLQRWLRREPWRAATVAVVLVALPTFAAGAGYLWANAPRIHAAAERERADLREQHLTAAWLAVVDKNAARMQAALTALGTEDVDREAVAARVALWIALERADEARAWLANHATVAPPAIVQALLAERTGDLAWDEATELESGDAFEHFVRGQLLYERAQQRRQDPALYRRSLALCARAVAEAPGPRAAFLLWWMVSAARAKDSTAYAHAEAAFERHFPDSEALLRARAFTASMQQPGPAIERFRAAIDSAQVPDLVLGFALATCLRKAGQVAAAVREFEAALQLDPDNVLGWSQLGLCRRDLGDRTGAIAALQEAVRRAPADAALQDNLGLCLREQGRREEATQAFAAAVAADPDNWHAHFNLAGLLAETNHLDQAGAHFERCLELLPGDGRAAQGLAQVRRLQQRPQQAFAATLRAAALAPQDASLQVQVARAALQLDLVDLAQAALLRATDLAGTEVATWRSLAETWLLPKCRDGARALTAARRGCELAAGKEPWLQLLLARSLAATGDAAGATQALAPLRDVAPGRADARLTAAIAELEHELAGNR